MIIKISIGIIVLLLVVTAGVLFKKHLFNEVRVADVDGIGEISIGDNVTHKKFGNGIIKAIQVGEEAHIIGVKFEDYGKKWIVAEHSSIELASNVR